MMIPFPTVTQYSILTLVLAIICVCTIIYSWRWKKLKIDMCHSVMHQRSKQKTEMKLISFMMEKNAIKNMYYVSYIKSNILGMRQLMEKGYSIFMKDRMMHLKDKRNRLIAHIKMIKNRMYKLTLRNIQEKCLKINMMNKSHCGVCDLGT
jgi:hypothetical protein